METCREVTRTLASDALESVGLWKRLMTRLHLLMCVHCNDYARQLAAIGAAARRLYAPSQGGDAGLDEIEKSLVARLSAPRTEKEANPPETQ